MEQAFELTAKNHQVLQNYLVSGHADFKTARHLIRAGYLAHGTMLAATCIEKYLKVIVGIGGVASKEHLCPKLVGQATKKYPKLLTDLDKNFIKFLEKSYRLRYAPMTAPGFSIVFNQFRTLIALDSLVSHIDLGFVFAVNGESQSTPYRDAVKAKDLDTVTDNCTVTESLLSELLIRANKVHELSVNKDFMVLEIQYETHGVSLAGDYTKIPELEFGKSNFTLTKG